MTTTMLGKRKRKEEKPIRRVKAVSPEQDEHEELVDAQEIFRRHFEAQFKPLPEIKKPAAVQEESSEEEEDEDSDGWEGLSESEDSTNVEVIEHTASIPASLMSKEELKRFMSSQPPTDTISAIFSATPKSARSTNDEDDPTEANNLKHDLALQRLLQESHLLDSAASSSPSGSNRHKATDLRLQALGAKTSILTQKNMPLSHRRGIVKKAGEKEEARRKQAKENGIILEVASKKSKGGEGMERKRERGVGGPGVGRFKGGTLTLSKKDVREIEGPRKSAGGRGGRGGGGRGGRGGRGKKR